jgi:hypothetical protein
MQSMTEPLVLYLEASSRFHAVQMLADPATATRFIHCTCGWESKRISFKQATKKLVPELIAHLTKAIKDHDDRVRA